MFVSFVERKVDNVARDLAHQTLFFRGARKSLVDPEFIGNEFIDVSSDLLDALDIMQRNLMEMRKNTLALIEAANVDTLGQLRQALQRMASAAAELFDEVTAFRGELLACEADYTARRDGLAACTHEDLDEVFRKIASDA